MELTAAARMRDHGVKLDIEGFDLGHMRQSQHLIGQGLFDAAFLCIMYRDWLEHSSNAESVNVVANLVEQLQREVATPDYALQMAGLDNREVE